MPKDSLFNFWSLQNSIITVFINCEVVEPEGWFCGLRSVERWGVVSAILSIWQVMDIGKLSRQLTSHMPVGIFVMWQNLDTLITQGTQNIGAKMQSFHCCCDGQAQTSFRPSLSELYPNALILGTAAPLLLIFWWESWSWEKMFALVLAHKIS